jgi:uncharacterized membrane protein YeaQ/YmgE (transglycosylase-associated protein family)
MKDLIYPARYSVQSLPEDDRECAQADLVPRDPNNHHPPMTSAGLGFIVSTFALAFTAHLAQTVPTAVEVQKMSKDIYPLIGGAFACCGVFALYDRRKETPWNIIGRVIFGMMGSFFAPWILSVLPVTWLQVEDYRGLAFIGTCGAVLGFLLSKSTIEKLFSRASSISGKLVDAGERRLDKELGD